MHKLKLKLLCLFVLAVLLSFQFKLAEAAQTINGKAIGTVDDVVKEVNKGELSIPKKGLITLRGGYLIGDVDIFATTFGADASASTRRLYHNLNARRRLAWTVNEPYYLRPAVSRKLYNGKRALMTHNLAPNGQLTYYFKTLSNTRSENSTETTPQALVNSVQLSDFGEYTSPAFSYVGSDYLGWVYGTGVMAVKGYEREIFVAVSSAKPNNLSSEKKVRLEFFAISADAKGKMTQIPLTELTHEISLMDRLEIVSIAVGDFDGDKYDNEIAVMLHQSNDIRLLVFRLNFSDGKLELKSMSDSSAPNGIMVHQHNWRRPLEEQAVGDMVAGDFDGDGKDEIAVLYKRPSHATALKNGKGWPDGAPTGDINCRVYSWNANGRYFDYSETAKDYHYERLKDGAFDDLPEAWITGVIGLRAAAADLDGDGKDEIVTLLLGYVHHKQWDAKIKAYSLRLDDFYAYPHLAVWTFNRGSIKPIHDDSHVKGGGQSGENNYNYGTLYNLVQDKNTKLLGDGPQLEWRRVWYDKLYTGRNKNEGTNPDSITHMYALVDFSIAAGPFTGQIGTFKTIDDIAVAWKRNGEDRVTVFKTKVNAAKQFDGFEDGKLVIQDKKNGGTWRGLVAVDLASEGVELDKPVHLRQKSNRSYVAVLNAIPYHVDTVSADGTALQEQPHNFTYSEYLNGGNMTVSYGKSTTDSTTNTVTQDLSQTVETMLVADPNADGQVFGTVKGIAMLASSISDLATGIKMGGMTPKDMFEKGIPYSPLGWLNDAVDFFTDKVDTVNQQTNTEASTTTIDKEITATTHDALLYTDTARHIWRYPVLTRPLPMWMTLGSRVDSVPVSPASLTGEKELYVTFTMSENSALHTANSINDDLYQPLHEEGNFFSYPAQIGDAEGYNDAGTLAEEQTWTFGSQLDNAGITFTKATSNMQHTEKTVTPSPFTMTTSFIDRLINGDKATGINMPETDNPKTFSKEYNKSERISYTLLGDSHLTSQQAAGHTVKMQPFVAKEGAMTFATAVELTSTNYDRLWQADSIYSKKSDPALFLPLKFVKDGGTFRANTYDMSAMKIRGMKFYVPDFAFYSDNRLVNGLKYEIRVPLYNASFKDTGNFNVRLSWAANNSPTAVKNIIGTKSVSLGGWRNDKTNNKGTAVFEWTPNLEANKQYYFYVEIDPENALDEVHEGRYKADNTTLNDYGGNNTGFSPFFVYNHGDISASSSGTVFASSAGYFRAADDEIQLSSLYFTDGDGNRVDDIAAFILNHSDDSFVTMEANFNYSGPKVPYAFFVGYILTPSGKQKIPNAGINTIVDLNNLASDDIEDVFMLNDIALFNGNNKVAFTFTPSDLIASENEIAAVADRITFGILTLTDDEIIAVEEFFEGVDPSFILDAIPDNIVSSATEEIYTFTADEEVFWNISSVKFNGEDAGDELDITIETISETVSDDTSAPSNYGKDVFITVSSIAGYTRKGEFEITVQRSTDDDDEWVDAGVLKFNAENASNTDNDGNNSGSTLHSSSSGCNAGLSFGTLALLISGLMAFRRKN